MRPQDHVLLGTAYAVDVATHSQLIANPAFLAEAMQEYNTQRTGMLTNVGGDLLGMFPLYLHYSPPPSYL